MFYKIKINGKKGFGRLSIENLEKLGNKIAVGKWNKMFLKVNKRTGLVF